MICVGKRHPQGKIRPHLPAGQFKGKTLKVRDSSQVFGAECCREVEPKSMIAR